MLITFSGLDGAGKTTIIRRLKATWPEERATVLTMYDDVGLYAMLRRLRNRIASTPAREMGRNPRADPRPSTLMRTVRSRWLKRAVYPIDVLAFVVCRWWFAMVGRRVILMDRYFYDTLVDLADDRHWRFVRLWARLTPAPDLAVFIDVPPEEAFARKGEYSILELQDRRMAYYELFRCLRKPPHILPNRDLSQSLDAVASLVDGART